MIHIISQGLASGLPTISTRHSGIPDQIIPGENGYLVDEGDYRALAEKIVYLAEHDELWAPMGHFGHEHVAKYYDSKATIQKQKAFYERFIENTD